MHALAGFAKSANHWVIVKLGFAMLDIYTDIGYSILLADHISQDGGGVSTGFILDFVFFVECPPLACHL